MNAAVKNTESAIWSRLVALGNGDFDEKTAEWILRFHFPQEDIEKVNELAEKAREGSLSTIEEEELENYRRVGRALDLLKSRARLALKRAGVAA